MPMTPANIDETVAALTRSQADDRPALHAYALWDGGTGTDGYTMVCLDLTGETGHEIAALVDPRFPEVRALLLAAPKLLNVVLGLLPVLERVADAGPCFHLARPLNDHKSAVRWLFNAREALRAAAGEGGNV